MLRERRGHVGGHTIERRLRVQSEGAVGLEVGDIVHSVGLEMVCRTLIDVANARLSVSLLVELKIASPDALASVFQILIIMEAAYDSMHL